MSFPRRYQCLQCDGILSNEAVFNSFKTNAGQAQTVRVITLRCDHCASWHTAQVRMENGIEEVLEVARITSPKRIEELNSRLARLRNDRQLSESPEPATAA